MVAFSDDPAFALAQRILEEGRSYFEIQVRLNQDRARNLNILSVKKSPTGRVLRVRYKAEVELAKCELTLKRLKALARKHGLDLSLLYKQLKQA